MVFLLLSITFMGIGLLSLITSCMNSECKAPTVPTYNIYYSINDQHSEPEPEPNPLSISNHYQSILNKPLPIYETQNSKPLKKNN